MSKLSNSGQDKAMDPVDNQEAGFVHLHCHSEYSSLDGGSQVKNMAAALKARGMAAMALTDHGVMQGLPQFYDALRDEGIKPILGIEAYLTDDRFDKTRGTPTYHLTLLAETTEGYHNLCKLSSQAFIDGTIMTFGRARARADWELLERYSKGVIAFTGCMAAPVMAAIFKGDVKKARENTERLIKIYGKDNVYGEIQNVGITVGIPGDSELAKKLQRAPLTKEEAAKYVEVEEGEVPLSQTDANRCLVEICNELQIKYLATGDVHYLDEKDANPHDAMICIGTGQLKNGSRRFSLLPKKYHLRTEEEMLEAVSEWPESLTCTLEVAKRCNAEITYGRELLPRFPLPEGADSSQTYLRSLCEAGLDERYGHGSQYREEALERLAFELDVINDMGFNDYFLIVWDLFNEANKRSIPSGPGRGSAAGSIVAYSLDITKLCPLEHKLLFERFLNPGRRSMPDIDMDFGVKGREELILYAKDKYNDLAGCQTTVAQIITFGKFKAKGALRDAARVMAEPSDDGRSEGLKLGDRLSRLIPDDPSSTMRSVWDDKKEGESLRKAHKQGGKQKEAIELAGWLEGFVRSNGIHAAAVLIADHDLTNDLPLQQFGPEKPLHVQYDMHYSEKLGLLKMDFLGLRNLDIIYDAVERIRHTQGVEIDPYNLPLDDAETFALLSRAESVGLFQLESSGMQGALKEVMPSEFNDVIALVALYRPGPMQNIPVYAARKHGREQVSYPDMPDEMSDKLSEILQETMGIIIYQEQSMIVARQMANFSPSQADDLRKAIGKKLRDKMDELKKPFYEGCKANGLDKDSTDWLWDSNEKSADYSFNKSHAACYGLLAYITAYLKAHYPNEYMASLLTAVMGDKDKPRLYLTEAKRMGLEVLPPDINRSLKDFAVLEREDSPGEWDILFGLTALRGVGSGVVSEMKSEREARGPFLTMFDLIRRMPHLNKTVIQSLAKGGALDQIGGSRKGMHDEVEGAIKRIRKEHTSREREFARSIIAHIETEAATQTSLFGVSAAGKQTTKLTPLNKKGVDAGAVLSWKEKGMPDEELLTQAIEDGLSKEHLRLFRAAARQQIKEETDEVAGIAAEESGESDKEKVERIAADQLADISDDILNSAGTLLPLVAAAIEAEWKKRGESEMIDAVLEGEIDPVLPADEWEDEEKLRLERKTLGTYVSGHPLDVDRRAWARYVSDGLGNIDDTHIGQTLRVVGVVTSIAEIKMRNGEILRRVSVEDLTGSREIIIFPRTLEGGLDTLLCEDKVVCFEVGVMEDTFTRANEESEESEDSETKKAIKLQASRLYRWEPNRVSEEIHPVNIEISQDHFNLEWVTRLRAVCAEHPGDNPVRLVLDGQGHKTELLVKPSDDLIREIKQLLED